MKPKTLKPVRPNLGLECEYRGEMLAWIELMQNSIVYWLKAAYKKNEPEMAQDAVPAVELQKAIKKLVRRWKRNFNEAAPLLAKWFATAQWKRSDKALQKILKDAGFSVKFKLTKSQRDILQATVAQNVSLIKSIPTQYLTQVEGLVMRSVQTGRDLSTLSKQLEKQFGVTKRRAILIARTQNNMATTSLVRARQLELGITEAVWYHSHAGKTPRPAHVAMDGKKFDLNKGMWDKDEKAWVHPGELINCLPGDSVIEFAAGVKKLWRRRYANELRFFITGSGKVIKATPNHPILTKRGWLPIKSINVGDDVACISNQIFDGIEVDIDGDKTTFSQLFDTAALFISPSASSVFQFHGDISDSKVDTIDIDSFLPDELDSVFCKQFAEFFFPQAYPIIKGCGFSTNSALASAGLRLFAAPQSVIRGFSILLPLFRCHLLGTQQIGFGTIPQLDALFLDATRNNVSARSVFFGKCKNAQARDVSGSNFLVGKFFNVLSRAAIEWQSKTPRANMLADDIRMNVNDRTNFFSSHSVLKKFDSVVDKGTIGFSDHVYNLENEFNWYTSDLCIVHNCRCFSRPIIKGFSS